MGNPAVTSAAIGAPLRSGRTRVSGPGQCRAASVLRPVVEQCDFSGLRQIPDMHDQRIEARPALGFVDARHRFAIGGVGSKPVDRLGRHRHGPARGDQARGLGDRVGPEGQEPGVLRAHAAAL